MAMSSTCECCGREHNGKGVMCFQCNNHGRSYTAPQAGRKLRSIEQAGDMEYTEEMERNQEDGWPYLDTDRDEFDIHESKSA